MAEAIAAAIVSATGTTIAQATIATAIKVAFVAAQIGYGVSQQRKAKKQAQAARNASLTDRNVTLRGASTPHDYVYGTVKKSTALIYATTQVVGPKEQYLWMVLSVAGHQCTGITDVYLDADPIGSLDSNGDVTGGRFYRQLFDSAGETLTVNGALQVTASRPIQGVLSVTQPGANDQGPVDSNVATSGYSLAGSTLTFTGSSGVGVGSTVTVNYSYVSGSMPLVRVKKYLGAPGQTADADLIAASGGQWTTEDTLTGETYIILRLRFDETAFATWTQQVSVLVQGKPLFDPRLNVTSFSDNSALAVRDYLTSDIGFALAPSFVDEALGNAAANVSDEAVPVNGTGTTQKRYTCNAVLSSESTLRDNLSILLATMAGSAVPVQGKWRIYPGAYRTPSITLTESDVIDSGDDTLVPTPGLADSFNSVRGQFVDETRIWQVQDWPPYVSSVYVAEDGGEVKYEEFNLDGVTQPQRATRIGKVLLHRARNGLQFEATFSLKAYNTMPGQTVRLAMPTYGFNGKVFRVLEREFSFEGWVRLALQEDVPSSYDWSYVEYPGAAAANNTNLPDPRVVPTVSGLNAVSGLAYSRTASDGSQQAQIHVAWTSPANSTVTQGGFVDVAYRRVSDQEWTPLPSVSGDVVKAVIEPVSRLQAYLIRARFRNGLGVSGPDWSYVEHIVSASAPSNTSQSVNGVGVNLLDNASFRYGPQGFFVQWSSGASASITDGQFVGSGNEVFACQDGAGSRTYLGVDLRPKPYGSVAHVETAGGAYGFGSARYLYSRAFACQAGERIELQCRAASSSADGRLYALFYNASGAFLSAVQVSGGVSDVLAGQASGLNQISNFVRLWGFVTVPSGATQVALGLQPKRNITSGTSSLVAGMAYLGRSHAGQTQPSPWTGEHSVGTEDMEREVATSVYRWSFGIGAPAIQQTVFLEAKWEVEITCSGTLNGVSTGNGYGSGVARGSIGDVQLQVWTPPVGTGPIINYGAFACEPRSVPVNVALAGTGVISETYTVPATGSYRFDSLLFASGVDWQTVTGSGTLQLTIIKR